jgi:hypothetical protein
MRRRLPLIPAAVAVAATTLLAAGCGGKGSARVANVASNATTATSTTATQHGALAFAQCVRSHGLPNWPDPTSNGGFDKFKLRQLGYTRPQVRAAERPCIHLLPPVSGSESQTPQQVHTQIADGVSFADCMRSHGVSRFPDPTALGQLTLEMVEAQGIDVHSPAVLRVVQACLPASHGELTPAKVREALRNAGH